jgi:hypothetical protein
MNTPTPDFRAALRDVIKLLDESWDENDLGVRTRDAVAILRVLLATSEAVGVTDEELIAKVEWFADECCMEENKGDIVATCRELIARYGTPAPIPAPHPDDEAVDRFAIAMKAKLAKKREEGRGGWQAASADFLSQLLHEHLSKGDPVDIGNFAMMLHQNGQPLVTLQAGGLDDKGVEQAFRLWWYNRYGDLHLGAPISAIIDWTRYLTAPSGPAPVPVAIPRVLLATSDMPAPDAVEVSDKEIIGCMYKGSASISGLEPVWIARHTDEVVAGARALLSRFATAHHAPVPVGERPLCAEKIDKALASISGGLCYSTAEAKHLQLRDAEKALTEARTLLVAPVPVAIPVEDYHESAYRALCAELDRIADDYNPDDTSQAPLALEEMRLAVGELADRARVLLAASDMPAPDAVGVSDNKLLACMIRAAGTVPDGQATGILDWPEEAVAAARAVLSRYGAHPAPVPVGERLPDHSERSPECLAQWPDCYEGGYDPKCCRFPKSCSCEVRRALPLPPEAQ